MKLGPEMAAVSGRGSGFTLFEILVVMVVIALSSAMVLPKLAGTLPKYSLTTSAKTLAASLRYAQNRAVSEIRPVAVVLDTENGQIIIRGLSPLQDPMEALLASSMKKADNSTQTYDLPAGINLEVFSTDERFEQGVFQMIFFPGGNTSGGTLRLSNESGKQVIVAVDKFSGRVRIDPPNMKGI